MDSTLLAALVSAGAALVVSLINNFFVNKESEKRHEANIVLISYKIEQLEKEVQKHNNMIERTYDLEKRSEVIEEQIHVANHRIEDLEKKVG